MRARSPLVAGALLTAGFALVCALGAALFTACPTTAGQRPCNTDRDCFVGDRCREGVCASDAPGAVDAGGPVDAGALVDAGAPLDAGADAGEARDAGADAGSGDDAGEGDAGEARDAGDAGEADAGEPVDAGEQGDAGPALCPVFDESFDGALDPLLGTYADPGCQVSFGGGAFVADLGPEAAGCGLFMNELVDASSAVVEGVFDDDLVDGLTQQYVALNTANGSYLMMLQFGPKAVARRQLGSGPFDDVVVPLMTAAPHVLRLTFTPDPAGERVVWSVGDGTSFTTIRDEVFADDDFTSAAADVTVQAFAPPSQDPPPLAVDEYALSATCP